MLASSATGRRPVRTVQVTHNTRFNAAELQEMERLTGHTRQFQPGMYVARRGHPFHDLYAVRSGSIQVCTTDAEGRRQMLGVIRPGELIGLDAMDIGHYRADYLALETSTVCNVPLDVLRRLLDRREDMLIRITRMLREQNAHRASPS